MQIGIAGLQLSGKTTLFNALTGARADIGGYRSTSKEHPNIAVVKVPDERLDKLFSLLNPPRQVNATIEYRDIAGITRSKGIDEKKRTQSVLNQIAEADMILQVVQVFEDASNPHPEGSIDPTRDIEIFSTEILLRDMEILEHRLSRLSKVTKQKDHEDEAREFTLLEKCNKVVGNEIPLREIEFTPEERKALSGFQFLTEKPLLIVLNILESDLSKTSELTADLHLLPPRPNTDVVVICGKLEMELSQLEQEDAQLFMEDMELQELATDRIIKASYKLLGKISFFTFGDKEIRAWAITNGMNAREAAGVVHSDMERGFIRAEVVSSSDLIKEKGNFSQCRNKGLLRLEGKEYRVRDGDVIQFRFNV